MSAKNLDGVNLDFEGEGSGDQAGLTALVSQVSGAFRAANPHWQVTMDTYASAAGDPGGFYDIAGLAPSVDAFFVMAYDMNGKSPSPTAPLTGSGFTDLQALQEYTSVVPAAKVILGVPYYGYDWPTSGPGLGATPTAGQSPLSYCQIVSGRASRLLGQRHPDGVDLVPGRQPVAPDLVRRPDVAGVEGPAGELVPRGRSRGVGARHGRERPDDARRPPRQRAGGEGLPTGTRCHAHAGDGLDDEHDHHDDDALGWVGIRAGAGLGEQRLDHHDDFDVDHHDDFDVDHHDDHHGARAVGLRAHHVSIRPTGDPDVVDNAARHRYEIGDGPETAGFTRYRLDRDVIEFVHTEIDPAHEGHGLGSRLARAALDDARDRHLRVVPSCPFIADYIRHHPEYDDITA